jgi:hypothetical protein
MPDFCGFQGCDNLSYCGVGVAAATYLCIEFDTLRSFFHCYFISSLLHRMFVVGRNPSEVIPVGSHHQTTTDDEYDEGCDGVYHQ